MRLGKALLSVSAGIAMTSALLFSPGASARAEAEARYSKAQAYSAALRYLRVDLGYDVTEKDPEAAYLIFKYEVPGKPQQASTGTLEIVDGTDLVRIYVKLAKLPEYHERVLRDGLLRKLREEYGAPPAKKPEPPKKPAPPEEKPAEDAGTD